MWDSETVSRPTDTRPPRPPVIEPSRADDLPVAVPTAEAYEPETEATTLETVSSILGSVQRGGNWLVPDRMLARALFGELKLDFTRADLPTDGVVEIECFVLCGQLEITLPEGSEIEMEDLKVFVSEVKHGVPRKTLREFLWRVIGGEQAAVEARPRARPEGEPPLFVVTGRVILGGVAVASR